MTLKQEHSSGKGEHVAFWRWRRPSQSRTQSCPACSRQQTSILALGSPWSKYESYHDSNALMKSEKTKSNHHYRHNKMENTDLGCRRSGERRSLRCNTQRAGNIRIGSRRSMCFVGFNNGLKVWSAFRRDAERSDILQNKGHIATPKLQSREEYRWVKITGNFSKQRTTTSLYWAMAVSYSAVSCWGTGAAKERFRPTRWQTRFSSFKTDIKLATRICERKQYNKTNLSNCQYLPGN